MVGGGEASDRSRDRRCGWLRVRGGAEAWRAHEPAVPLASGPRRRPVTSGFSPLDFKRVPPVALPPPSPPVAPIRARGSSVLEIQLAGGRVVRVDADVDAAKLAAIVAELEKTA